MTLNSLDQHAPVNDSGPRTQALTLITDDRDQSKISHAKQALLHGKYPVVFDGIGKLHVNPQVPPVSQTFRGTPFHLHKQLDSLLEEALREDITEPVKDECTDWVSGLVVAPKPHNPKEIRVCGDYCHVNQATTRERHPNPTVDELFKSMSGAVMFSKVDLKADYHQIPLDMTSCTLSLSRHTGKGLFCCKRLPFGICSASEVF